MVINSTVSKKKHEKQTLYKIMFYINTLKNGGAERAMSNLASEFAKNGHDVRFVTSVRTDGEYQLSPTVERLVLEEFEMKQNRWKKNILRIQKLRRFCKMERPDVLIAFMAEPNFRAVLASLGLPARTIISVRNDPNKEYARGLFRFVGRYILPFADGCVFQTEEARNWFPKKLQRKSAIIFNAVQPQFYQVKRRPKEQLIVACGRLEPQKNHKMLIQAFCDVVKEHPKARLRIYGEGRLRGEIEQLIKKCFLTEYVHLMGTTADVPVALAEADVFVLSSDFEGMPNALMEAMAIGLPCISTDCPCGGSRLLLENGRNGALIPPRDQKRLADAINKLLDDADLKDNYAVNAKAAAGQFTSGYIYREWKRYIETIL